jgi:DNA-binding response OmpR family regulator
MLPAVESLMSESEAQHRVLLIDDDELVSGSLRQYLGENGFAVDAAPEPATAMVLMSANLYSVILVDPYLTGGVRSDNAELLQRVCAMQRDAAIIVLTAYGCPSLEQAAADCNVTAMLTKPQSVVFLENMIRTSARSAQPAVRDVAPSVAL